MLALLLLGVRKCVCVERRERVCVCVERARSLAISCVCVCLCVSMERRGARSLAIRYVRKRERESLCTSHWPLWSRAQGP